MAYSFVNFQKVDKDTSPSQTPIAAAARVSRVAQLLYKHLSIQPQPTFQLPL